MVFLPGLSHLLPYPHISSFKANPCSRQQILSVSGHWLCSHPETLILSASGSQGLPVWHEGIFCSTGRFHVLKWHIFLWNMEVSYNYYLSTDLFLWSRFRLVQNLLSSCLHLLPSIGIIRHLPSCLSLEMFGFCLFLWRGLFALVDSSRNSLLESVPFEQYILKCAQVQRGLY